MQFPTTLPLVEVDDVINAIKTKTVNKAKLAQDLWTIIGFAFSKVFVNNNALSATAPINDDQAMEMLESLKSDDLSINWLSLTKWALTLALQLI